MTGIGVVGARAGGRQESELNVDRTSVLQEGRLWRWVWGWLHSNEFAVKTVNCELKNKDGDSSFMYILSELRII